MPRPDPLSPSARRVVYASRELDATSKLVWSDIAMLDRGPDGCFCRPDTLAARVGVSRETLERQRRVLVAAGLLTKAPRRGYTDSWFATLPPDCMPDRRPTEDEVLALATRLDAHLRNGAPPPPEPGVTHVTRLVSNVALHMTPGLPKPGVVRAVLSPDLASSARQPGVTAMTPPLSSESTESTSVLRDDENGRVGTPTTRTDNGRIPGWREALTPARCTP